jgi:hypothetical protein
MKNKLTKLITKYTTVQQALQRRRQGVETPEDFLLLLKESETAAVLQQPVLEEYYCTIVQRYKDYLSKN